MNQYNLAPISGGILALLVTVITAVLVYRYKRDGTWQNSIPLLAGLLAGCAVLGFFAQSYAPHDRFFLPQKVYSVVSATIIGCFLVWSVELIVPAGSRFRNRLIAHLLAQLAAAAILVWAGVRFNLMKLPGIDVASLGTVQSGLLTIAWLVTVLNFVRLLDGIHGAAAVVVVGGGLAGLVVNANHGEYFLTGMSLVTVGIAGGTIWFSGSAKRLPLEGSGTAILGLLFAVLTVLARQKTVTATLLITPVILVILIAGATMMGLLEKRLLLPGPETEESDVLPGHQN